jgi:type I restriction enzyme S subunit
MVNDWLPAILNDVVSINISKVLVSEIQLINYVSTDSMLPDFGGIVPASKLPSSGKVTRFKKGDILFSNIRTYFKKLWLADKAGACSNDVIVFRPNDDIDSGYVFHLLMNQEFIEYTVKTSKGTKMPRGDKDAIMKYEFELAPEGIRGSISSTLLSFKNKIELNRQTNQTLEQMAQTLFKSWFVDFDPVFDNALLKAGISTQASDSNENNQQLLASFPEAFRPKAKLRLNVLRSKQQQGIPTQELGNESFPSEFEFNEQLGWIPKGWEVSKLSELISIKHGYAYKGEFFSDEKTEDILLTPGNVSVGGGFKNAKYKYYNGPIHDEYIFKEGDMYVTMTDLSKVSDTLGYPAIVPKIEGVTFHHNQRLGKIFYKECKSAQKEFIYQQLCGYESRNNVLGSATGTTVKHTSPTKILSLSICHSGGIVESIFEANAKTLSGKASANNLSNIELTKLRDTLLPKLISGEINISPCLFGTEVSE